MMIEKTGPLSGVVVSLALATTLTVRAGSLEEWPLKDLFQQAQFVVEGRVLPRYARSEPISFQDSGAQIPTLACNSWRFIRGETFKNVLGQDLPDTLLVFDAGTAAAVSAYRAAYLGGETEAPPGHFYRGPLSPSTLAREKFVILFMNQVIDDSTVSPRERFEFTAVQSYEKSSAKAVVRKLAARSALDQPLQ